MQELTKISKRRDPISQNKTIARVSSLHAQHLNHLNRYCKNNAKKIGTEHVLPHPHEKVGNTTGILLEADVCDDGGDLKRQGFSGLFLGSFGKLQ